MAIQVEVLCHIHFYYGKNFYHFPVISVVNFSPSFGDFLCLATVIVLLFPEFFVMIIPL